MQTLIILLAIVFLVLTIMVIARTQKLLKGIKGKEAEQEKSNSYVDSANDFNAIALLVFWVMSAVGVIWSFNEYKGDFLMSGRDIWTALGDVPVASSKHGRETDYWFWVSMLVITAAFFVVNSVLFYFPVKYRYKEGRKAFFYSHNNNLEKIWTAIPAFIMAGLVFTGLKVWNKTMDDAPENSEVIEIMAKQFGWQVRYPGVSDNKLGRYNYKLTDATNEFGIDLEDESAIDDFTNNSEVHIPVGKPVLFKIRSRDVLHSLYIPHMRVKMDAVPGMPTKFWFEPEKTTADMQAELGDANFKYEIACAEVCGRSHFGMRLVLVVESQEDYDKWKKEQKSFLASNPDYVEKIKNPAVKAKALKYLESLNPTAPAAEETAVAAN
jgi:cytochrome c oxidase subunit II